MSKMKDSLGKNVGARRPADVFPVVDDGLDDQRRGQGGDGEIDALEPQRQIPRRQAHEPVNDAGDDDYDRQGQGERLVQGDRGVNPGGEKSGAAEIHVAGEAAQDIPRHGHHQTLQNHVDGEEIKLVVDELGKGEPDDL